MATSNASPIQLDELIRIAQLGIEPLTRVRAAVDALDGQIVHPQRLLKVVAGEIGQEAAEPLVRHLLSLHGMSRQTGRSIDEVLSSVQSSVTRYSRTHDGADTDWATTDCAFRDLLNTRTVRLAAAAVDLAYDFTNLLQRTRILTDVRPIYDMDGNDIEGAVVSYTLRLRYDNAEGEHEISIALDSFDVDSLRDQCDRAKRKATCALRLMGKNCGIPAAVSGEVADD